MEAQLPTDKRLQHKRRRSKCYLGGRNAVLRIHSFRCVKQNASCHALDRKTHASNTESTTANRHIGVVLKSHNCQLQLNTDSNESKHTEAQLPTKRLAPFRSLISANCNLIPVLMVLRRCTRPRPRRPVAAADACLVHAVCTVATLLKSVHWLLDRCQKCCKLQLIKPSPMVLVEAAPHPTPARKSTSMAFPFTGRCQLLRIASYPFGGELTPPTLECFCQLLGVFLENLKLSHNGNPELLADA